MNAYRSLCTCICLLLGCGIEQPQNFESEYPLAGLYTPGNLLGASDPTDLPMANAALGQRCAPLSSGAADGGVGTAGQLLVVYKTRTLAGRYAPKNCTAVWIETMDGRYVATLELAALLRKPALVYFQEHACEEKPGPDIVTSATLSDHEKPHTLMWNGTDLNDMSVPDGPYVLFIEVTESDKEPGVVATYDFDKGPVGFSGERAVAVDGALDSINLEWAPAGVGGGG